MEDRDDLTGEHGAGDAGQAVFAVLFLGVWVADSFFLHLTTQLTLSVPSWVRGPFAILLLGLSITCAWSGLMIVFGEVRETPAVIRNGIFGVVRHPVYISEVLLYAALSLFTMSLASCVVGLAATSFLYYLSRYEERLLLKRFGEEYRFLYARGWHVVPAASTVMARGYNIHPCGSRNDQNSIGDFAVGLNAGQVRAGGGTIDS